MSGRRLRRRRRRLRRRYLRPDRSRSSGAVTGGLGGTTKAAGTRGGPAAADRPAATRTVADGRDLACFGGRAARRPGWRFGGGGLGGSASVGGAGGGGALARRDARRREPQAAARRARAPRGLHAGAARDRPPGDLHARRRERAPLTRPQVGAQLGMSRADASARPSAAGPQPASVRGRATPAAPDRRRSRSTPPASATCCRSSLFAGAVPVNAAAGVLTAGRGPSRRRAGIVARVASPLFDLGGGGRQRPGLGDHPLHGAVLRVDRRAHARAAPLRSRVPTQPAPPPHLCGSAQEQGLRMPYLEAHGDRRLAGTAERRIPRAHASACRAGMRSRGPVPTAGRRLRRRPASACRAASRSRLTARRPLRRRRPRPHPPWPRRSPRSAAR